MFRAWGLGLDRDNGKERMLGGGRGGEGGGDGGERDFGSF